MTLIAGIIHDGHTYVAGDALCSHSERGAYATSEPKVWRSGEFIVGGSGAAVDIRLVQHKVDFTYPEEGDDFHGWHYRTLLPELLEQTKKHTPHQLPDLLIAVRGRLFTAVDGLLEECEGFAAIGADIIAKAVYEVTHGQPPKERLTAMLTTAAKLKPGNVGAPYTFMEAGQ